MPECFAGISSASFGGRKIALRSYSKVKIFCFYKDYNQPNGASSHIDDKYALDVDDAFAVEDILPLSQKRNLVLKLTKTEYMFQKIKSTMVIFKLR